jgi:hypothetical protein
LPADVVDGGCQPDQQRRIRHLSYEKWDHSEERRKPQRKSEKATIQEIDSEVESQIALNELIVGEGVWHKTNFTLTSCLLTIRKILL